MDLKHYMNSLSPDQRKTVLAQLAEEAGVSESCINSYIYRIRRCPPDRALKIEAVLKGQVTAHEIVFGSALQESVSA